MAFGVNKLQKISIRQETAFGDTLSSGDFSGGVLLRTVEAVDMGAISREAIGDNAVRRSFEDVGLPALPGRAEAKVSLSLRMCGATRQSGAIQADGLSTVLDLLVGERRAPSDSTCGTECTTTLIVTSGSYQVGDVLLIGGHARVVTAVGTGDVTIAPPLPSAPTNGTAIIACESYRVTAGTAQPSIGLGIERVGDAEMVYRLAGCAATGLSLGEIAPGSQIVLNAEMTAAEWARGSVTHATTDMPDRYIVAGVGDVARLVLADASGAYWAPVVASIAPSLSVSNLLVEGLAGDAVGGRVGVVPDIPDGEAATITLLQDPTATVLTKAEALVGKVFSACFQVGTASGSIVGVAYPQCTISALPKPADASGVKAVEFSIRASAGVLFRG